jgi:MFS family permease
VRRYREILTLPGAWKFSAAGLLARSGSAMAGLGIVLMVSSLYNSYGLAGAVVAANATAWALGTAVLANLVDRYGQRRVMYPATVISALALSTTVVVAANHLPAWMLFPPVIIAGATSGSPGALVRARWNHLLDDPDQLHTAFSLESSLDEITYVVGPVAATALATWVHPAAGVAAPVVLSLLGAKLFYSQRATEPPPQPVAHSGSSGVRPALLIPGVAPVAVIGLLLGCIFGAIDVSVVAAATSWDVRAASGVVLGVFSLSSAAAGLTYGSRQWKSSTLRRLVIAMLSLFVTTVILLAARDAVSLGLLGLLLGATVAPSLISANSLIGQLVPASRLTEGLAWVGTGIGIGASIGSSVAGQLIDHAGYGAGLATVTGFGLLAAVLTLTSARRIRRAICAIAEPADPERQPTGSE